MRWTWNDKKNRVNKRKHGLSFESAQYVFTDPLALTRLDSRMGEERYQTVGRVGQLTVLVVHTWPDFDVAVDEDVGRIISARKATGHERKAYEERTF